jgi:uncharacterized protein
MDTSPRYMPEGWVIPEVTTESHAFFTSGQMRIQKCLSCGEVQHPPLDLCNNCQRFEFEYVLAEPEGVVESYTVVHHAVHQLLKDIVPYNVAVIALKDYRNIRVVGNVVNALPGQLAIGVRVVATWAVIPAGDDHGELKIPQWEIVSG